MDVRRYNVERSCLRCHDRKVRCDRGSPCDKCQRLNLPCQYPGPKRVKRRAPKSNNSEMTARLEQLEQSIAELASQPTPPPQATSQPLSAQILPSIERVPSGEASSGSEVQQRSPDGLAQTSHRGFLVKNGSYVDEPFLSKVLEKEHELQSAMGTPDTNPSASRKIPPMRVDGIITNPHLMQVDFQSLLPTRWQATQLWETFLSRVDPVLKCIHVPSIKPHIFSAISRPESAPADVHCLLFAIFYGAATALASDDPGNDKLRADLQRYQQGVELAMYQSSFLDSPTVKSLQAMAIYLTSLRCNNSGRAGFTLRGLAIRAAQSIGLHRDGRHFKLPPLECELRRRLWWILFSTDARMAEDHGITIAEQGYGGDTELPANIDDANVDETTTDPVSSQPRWTETTFNLIIAKANKSLLSLSTTSAHENARAQELLTQLKTTIHEKYTQYGDFDIPIQRMGIFLSKILLTKFEFQLHQKALELQPRTSMNTEATQDLLRMAVDSLNLGLQMYEDELLRGFRWLSSTYAQFHLLTYILWHLCVHPNDPYAGEAWSGVNHHFDLVERDPSWPDPGPKWPMLVQLRAKAMRIRNAAFVAQQEASRRDSDQIKPVPGVAPVDEAVMLEPMMGIDELDLTWSEFFPDWNYMAENIAFMGPGQDGFT